MAEPRNHPTDDMSFEDAAIWLLKSIDVSMKELVTAANRRAQQANAAAAGKPADDKDLDSQYGDPEVKFIPKRWTGDQRLKGRKFSECPAEFLDVMAEQMDWSAGKADENHEMTNSGKPIGPYRRKDAARARGWARRIRAGWKPTAATASRSDAAERYRQQVEDDGDEPL